jgi:hypothetical protein
MIMFSSFTEQVLFFSLRIRSFPPNRLFALLLSFHSMKQWHGLPKQTYIFVPTVAPRKIKGRCEGKITKTVNRARQNLAV